MYRRLTERAWRVARKRPCGGRSPPDGESAKHEPAPSARSSRIHLRIGMMTMSLSHASRRCRWMAALQLKGQLGRRRRIAVWRSLAHHSAVRRRLLVDAATSCPGNVVVAAARRHRTRRLLAWALPVHSIGRCARNHPEWLIREVEQLRNDGRVWIVVSHASNQVEELRPLLTQLGSTGRELQHVVAPRAGDAEPISSACRSGPGRLTRRSSGARSRGSVVVPSPNPRRRRKETSRARGASRRELGSSLRRCSFLEMKSCRQLNAPSRLCGDGTAEKR
jgi:hypothetical protein